MRPLQIRVSTRPSEPEVPPPVPPPDPTPGTWGKDLIVGLVDRKGIPRNPTIYDSQGQSSTVDLSPSAGGLGVIRGGVYTANWKAEEPTQGSRTFGGGTFFSNAAAKNLKIRVRPQRGKDSPAWAMQLCGGPLTGLTEPQGASSTSNFDIPYVWEDIFLNAADAHDDWLIGELMSLPAFAEYVVSQPMTFYQEMFIWQMAVEANRTAFINTKDINPGFKYTKEKQYAAYERCIRRAENIAPGKTKCIVYNPFQGATDDGAPPYPMFKSHPWTYDLMEVAAQTGEIQHMNHSFRSWPTGSSYRQMYDQMASKNQPVAFQTVNTSGGDPTNSWWGQNPDATLYTVCRDAIDNYGACSLELPGTAIAYTSPLYSTTTNQVAGQNQKQLTIYQMEDLNTRMEANAAPFTS